MDSTLRQAIDHQKAGHTGSAIALLEGAIAQSNHCAHSQHFLGLLLQITGRSDAAESALRAALKLNPQLGDAWFALGNVLQLRHQKEEALDCFRQATNITPNSVAAWMHRSMMARQMGLYQESWECSTQALTLDPKNPKTWLATLSTLGFLRRYEQGLAFVRDAVAVFPDNPEILCMQGMMLTASGRYEEALRSYQSALSLAPENPASLNALGSLHSNYFNAIDAVDFHIKALEREPASSEAILGLGSAWLRAGYPAEAMLYFKQALDVGQSTYDAFDGLLLAIQYMDGQEESEIFDQHRKWNEIYAKKWYPGNAPKLEIGVRSGQRPLRVGFVSPDLHKHSVTRFVAPLFRHWELTGFELFVYSDVRAIDESSLKMQALGGHWRYTVEMSEDTLADQIRTDAIDILVDLAGHTGNHRLLVFARQPAPIQVSWLGYPNTTGLDTIAYRISDAIADPQGRSDLLSSESLIRMERGFHCFTPPIALPEINPAPVLRRGQLTFGSFNNQAKITDLTLMRWAMLLQAITGSRLVLKNPQLRDPRNRVWMTDRFKRMGIDPSRLQLVGFLEKSEDHYALYQQIDIALDTFPYNGTTTTCEALWMGVPVMTWIGDNHRGRTSASLLTHAGLSDWIAHDDASWINLAKTHASNPEQLNHLRIGLRKQAETSPLGDAKGFTLRFASTLRNLIDRAP